MGRPALSKEQRAAARLRIREAALRLYRAGGLEAITMRAVAAESELSASALYGYFPNRRVLLQALWYEPVVGAIERLKEVAASIAEPRARIERMLAVYIEMARDNPEIYRGAFLYVRPGDAQPPPVQPLETADFHCLLRDAIREGQVSGALRDGDAEGLAQCLWAGLHGALALPVHLEMYAFADPVDLAGSLAGLMVRGLERGGRPTPAPAAGDGPAKPV